MKRIFKYKLPVGNAVKVMMPREHRILCIREQGAHGGDEPYIWAIVDDAAENVEHTFRIHGTGHTCEGIESWKHVGTFFLQDGAIVFHVFRPMHPSEGKYDC